MKFLLNATAFAIAAIFAAPPALAAGPDLDPADWPAVLAEAEGQTVYFHAWGGADNINDYIAWAGERVAEDYGVTLELVKLTDTAEAISRVLAERAAGRDAGGAVDLVWINGENFAAMKKQELLLGNRWAEKLPNYQLADTENKEVLIHDFTVPVDGQESPWGLAQLTFYYDSAELSDPPTTLEELADYIAANPGRFTYAAPPNFIGTTFLKQLAFGLMETPDQLYEPADPETFDAVTAPVWDWLDKAQPDLWRSGEAYAADTTQLKNLLADREIDIAMTFNPGEASSAINQNLLPDTVRSFVLDYGSLGNAHFLAIPYNANARAGAMVVANFMLSPEAQARKADETVWGDPTVLAYDKLSDQGKASFDALEQGPATLSPAEMGATIREPHASWTALLEAEWAERYGAGS